jgi:hypothetical protein
MGAQRLGPQPVSKVPALARRRRCYDAGLGQLISSEAWNSATGERLEATGWGPTLDRSGFNV